MGLLILDKGYAAVTVLDIINRAYVGAQPSIPIFWSRVEELHVFLPQQHEQVATSGEGRLICSLAMFKQAQSYRQVYQVLASKQGGTIVLRHFQQMLTRDRLKRVER